MKLNSPYVHERWIDGDACGDCEGEKVRKVPRLRDCHACGGTGKKPVEGWASPDTERETCEICEGAKKLTEVLTVPCQTCGGEGLVNLRRYILLPTGEMIPDPGATKGGVVQWEIASPHEPPHDVRSAAIAVGPWFPFTAFYDPHCEDIKSVYWRRAVIYAPNHPLGTFDD